MLSALHPLPKLVVCLAWIVASILLFDARFQFATILVVATALVMLERKSPLFVLVLIVPFALFGLGFLTTSVLFLEESDFALRMAEETPFASPAFSAGIVLFLRAIACGMASALFVLTTDPGDLIKALMASWRLPPSIGYALFSALQLMPDLAAEAQHIRLARAMRRGTPPRRIASPFELFSLLIPLLAFAIRRAGRAAIAMEARGLGGLSRRTIGGAPKLRGRDIAFALVSAALLALSIWWTVRS